MVFTLPALLAAWAAAHPGPLYELLFQAASATLRELAAELVGPNSGPYLGRFVLPPTALLR